MQRTVPAKPDPFFRTMLSYDVDDRLGNFAPLSRPQDTYLVGFRRSALGLAVARCCLKPEQLPLDRAPQPS